MVTKMERTSIADASPKSQTDRESAIKALTGKTKDLVTATIKARTESFAGLCEAAAHAAYLGIVYGRWEQLNRLFGGLPNIDANALKQTFMLRVNDKYAVDGVHEKDAEGNELETWAAGGRPTTMIVFTTNPANKGEHFSLAKVPESSSGDKADAKRKLIQAYRDKVEAAGIDDLASIEWISRAKVIATPTVYDVTNFKKRLATLLSNFIKEGGNDPESGLNKSYIEGIMRAAAFDKPQLSLVRTANPAVMLESSVKHESKPETNSGENENRAAA